MTELCQIDQMVWLEKLAHSHAVRSDRDQTHVPCLPNTTKPQIIDPESEFKMSQGGLFSQIQVEDELKKF